MNDKAQAATPKDENDDVDKMTGVSRSTENLLLITIKGYRDQDMSARQNTELRWLDNARQYLGKATSDERLAVAIKKSRSTLVGKLTRNLANTGEARVADMVLPVDERNWSIDPVIEAEVLDLANPETESGRDPADIPQGQVLEPEPEVDPNTGQQKTDPATGEPLFRQPGDSTVTEMDAAQGLISAIKKRVAGMISTIETQLKRCAYEHNLRELIHRSALLGTGIIKGPVTISKRPRIKFVFSDGEWSPVKTREQEPGIEIVDCWHFFPDYQARSIEECNHYNERHIETRLQFQRLAKDAGWSQQKIQDTVERGRSIAGAANTNYQSYLEITTDQSVNLENRFEVWEVTISLSKEQDMRGEAPDWWGDDDVQTVRIFYNEDFIFDIRPVLLDTEEPEYHRFPWEDDPTQFWGQGVPELCSTSAKLAKGALRALSDNMGFARGPIGAVNEMMVEPSEGGNFDLEPLKMFRIKQSGVRVRDAISFIDIPVHTDKFLAVLDRAEEMARAETSQPPLVTGEGSQYQTDRVGGMQILQNNVNIVDRRRLKSFDDHVIGPLVKSFYHYNMQEHPDEGIKGDYIIRAKGATELLEKHMRGQSVQLLSDMALHPVFGPMHLPYETAELIYRSAQFDPQSVLMPKSKALTALEQTQKAAQQAAQAEGGGGMSDDEATLNAEKLMLEREKMQNQLEIEQIKRETKLIELATNEGIKMADIEAKLETMRAQDKTKRDAIAAEIALKDRAGSGI